MTSTQASVSSVHHPQSRCVLVQLFNPGSSDVGNKFVAVTIGDEAKQFYFYGYQTTFLSKLQCSMFVEYLYIQLVQNTNTTQHTAPLHSPFVRESMC